MAKIKCLSNYRNSARGLFFEAGESYEMDDSLVLYLKGDSPKSFEFSPAKKTAKPKRTTAVKKAPVQKGANS